MTNDTPEAVIPPSATDHTQSAGTSESATGGRVTTVGNAAVDNNATVRKGLAIDRRTLLKTVGLGTAVCTEADGLSGDGPCWP